MTKTFGLLAARICAGFAYLSLLLQWFLVAALYFGVAEQQAWFRSFREVNDMPVVVEHAPQASTFGVLEILVVGFAIIAVTAATIYTVSRLPKAIVRKGDALTHASADALVPLILARRHTRPTERERRRLSERMVWAIKIVLSILPLIALIPVTVGGEHVLEPAVTWSVALFLVASSSLWFMGEWACTRLYRATPKKHRQ